MDAIHEALRADLADIGALQSQVEFLKKDNAELRELVADMRAEIADLKEKLEMKSDKPTYYAADGWS